MSPHLYVLRSSCARLIAGAVPRAPLSGVVNVRAFSALVHQRPAQRWLGATAAGIQCRSSPVPGPVATPYRSFSADSVNSKESDSPAPVPERAEVATEKIAAPTAAPAPLVLPPADVFNAACDYAVKKSKQPMPVTIALAFYAGAILSIAGLLYSAVGGCSPALLAANPGLGAFLKGAVGIPVGITLIVLTGAELATGNFMYMTAGLLRGAVTSNHLARNWVLSYFGCMAGTFFMAWLTNCAGIMSSPVQIEAATHMAEAKTSMPVGMAVSRGVLCNSLVCLGIWGALASQTMAGKVIAIWMPVSTFITLGFEHSIANMFLIPQGMFAGADISFAQMFINNIIPVTIGNVIGGAFVATVPYIAYNYKHFMARSFMKAVFRR